MDHTSTAVKSGREGWQPGRHAQVGTKPKRQLCSLGALVTSSSTHSLRDIQYRNCKFYIKRVKSQMHMSQQCHKVNLLSSTSARTLTLKVSVGGSWVWGWWTTFQQLIVKMSPKMSSTCWCAQGAHLVLLSLLATEHHHICFDSAY